MKEKKTASQRGKSNRARGHSFEVQIVNLLKQYGYEASSARLSSRALDNMGIDIDTNAPYNIQCKYVERLSPSPHEIIKAMPRVGNSRNLLAWKRAHQGTLICMDITDFCDLLLASPPDKGALSEEELGL